MATIAEGLYDLGYCSSGGGFPYYGYFPKRCAVVAEGYLWFLRNRSVYSSTTPIDLYKTRDCVNFTLVNSFGLYYLIPIAIGYYNGKIQIFYRSDRTCYFNEYDIATDSFSGELKLFPNGTTVTVNGDMWIDTDGSVHTVTCTNAAPTGVKYRYRSPEGVWDAVETVFATSSLYYTYVTVMDGIPYVGHYYNQVFKKDGDPPAWNQDTYLADARNYGIYCNPDDDVLWLGYYKSTAPNGYYANHKTGAGWQGAEEISDLYGRSGDIVQANDGYLYCLYYQRETAPYEMKICKRLISGGEWSSSVVHTDDAEHTFMTPCAGAILPPVSNGVAFTFTTRDTVASDHTLWLYIATAELNIGTIPEVTSVDPGEGYQGSSVNLEITGTDFAAGDTVELRKLGETTIHATDVVVESSVKITCTVDLSGAALGDWDVVVINSELREGTLAAGFEVLAVPDPTILTVNPTSGGVNKLVTISGVNFGVSQEQSKVFFRSGLNLFEAEISSWGSAEIICYSPEIPRLGAWDIVVRIVSNE